ncbi:hypothetical protein [Neisseria sicca]|uniref:hypothetical protein n=1 Tax=Neisseria sicca TaxID=490 RepID=UPI00131D94A3|nr:hypothetical protein [Neisseria sicca]
MQSNLFSFLIMFIGNPDSKKQRQQKTGIGIPRMIDVPVSVPSLRNGVVAVTVGIKINPNRYRYPYCNIPDYFHAASP